MKKTQRAADLEGKCYDYRFGSGCRGTRGTVHIPRGHSNVYKGGQHETTFAGSVKFSILLIDTSQYLLVL